MNNPAFRAITELIDEPDLIMYVDHHDDVVVVDHSLDMHEDRIIDAVRRAAALGYINCVDQRMDVDAGRVQYSITRAAA